MQEEYLNILVDYKENLKNNVFKNLETQIDSLYKQNEYSYINKELVIFKQKIFENLKKNYELRFINNLYKNVKDKIPFDFFIKNIDFFKKYYNKEDLLEIILAIFENFKKNKNPKNIEAKEQKILIEELGLDIMEQVYLKYLNHFNDFQNILNKYYPNKYKEIYFKFFCVFFSNWRNLENFYKNINITEYLDKEQIIKFYFHVLKNTHESNQLFCSSIKNSVGALHFLDIEFLKNENPKIVIELYLQAVKINKANAFSIDNDYIQKILTKENLYNFYQNILNEIPTYSCVKKKKSELYLENQEIIDNFKIIRWGNKNFDENKLLEFYFNSYTDIKNIKEYINFNNLVKKDENLIFNIYKNQINKFKYLSKDDLKWIYKNLSKEYILKLYYLMTFSNINFLEKKDINYFYNNFKSKEIINICYTILENLNILADIKIYVSYFNNYEDIKKIEINSNLLNNEITFKFIDFTWLLKNINKNTIYNFFEKIINEYNFYIKDFKNIEIELQDYIKKDVVYSETETKKYYENLNKYFITKYLISILNNKQNIKYLLSNFPSTKTYKLFSKIENKEYINFNFKDLKKYFSKNQIINLIKKYDESIDLNYLFNNIDEKIENIKNYDDEKSKKLNKSLVAKETKAKLKYLQNLLPETNQWFITYLKEIYFQQDFKFFNKEKNLFDFQYFNLDVLNENFEIKDIYKIFDYYINSDDENNLQNISIIINYCKKDKKIQKNEKIYFDLLEKCVKKNVAYLSDMVDFIKSKFENKINTTSLLTIIKEKLDLKELLNKDDNYYLNRFKLILKNIFIDTSYNDKIEFTTEIQKFHINILENYENVLKFYLDIITYNPIRIKEIDFSLLIETFSDEEPTDILFSFLSLFVCHFEIEESLYSFFDNLNYKYNKNYFKEDNDFNIFIKHFQEKNQIMLENFELSHERIKKEKDINQQRMLNEKNALKRRNITSTKLQKYLSNIFDDDNNDDNNDDNKLECSETCIMPYNQEKYLSLYDIKEIKNFFKNSLNERTEERLKENIKKIYYHFKKNEKLITENQFYRIIQLKENWQESLELLKNEFPNFSNVIDNLLKEFSLNKLSNNYIKWHPMLLVGKPGIGKTEFCKKLSDLFNIPNFFLDVSTSTASVSLSGNEKFWHSGHYGKIFEILFFNDILNPIFILDEIDKTSQVNSTHGDTFSILTILHTLLEKTSAEKFIDKYIDEFSINASNINWIATANYTYKIPQTILSRFNIIEIDPPTKEQNKIIIQNIYQNLYKEYDLNDNIFNNTLNNEIIDKLLFLTPRKIKEILKEALGQAAINKEKELKIQHLNLTKIEQYNSKQNINYDLTKPFELYSKKELDNFNEKLITFEKEKQNIIFNILSKIIKNEEFKLRLLPNNWKEILDNFDELFPNFKDFSNYLRYNFIIAQKNQQLQIYFKPVLFVGEAGIGKTAAIEWLAKQFNNLPFNKIDMATCENGIILNGISTSFSNCQVGKIFESLAYQPISNPIILLDEFEKAFIKDVSIGNCFHTLLEHNSSKLYKDECIDISLNTQWVNWVATANQIVNLPEPIINRFKIIKIHKPTKEQSKIISQNIYTKLLKEHQIDNLNILENKLNDEVLEYLTDFVPRTIQQILNSIIGKIIWEDKQFISKNDLINITKDLNNKKSLGFI